MSTNKTRNTIKLNSKDLFEAARVAANSFPCTGSLRESAKGVKDGPNSAYCIMGCIVQGVANRRHIGFEKAACTLFNTTPDYLMVDHEPEMVYGQNLSYKLLGDDSESIIDINDAFELPDYSYRPTTNDGLRGYRKEIDKARNWQVKTLTKMAKAMARQEKAE